MPETVAAWVLTVMVWNVLGRRFDYKRTWSKRMPRVVARIKKHNPDVAILTECQQAEAEELAGALGYRWANYLGSTILYRPEYTLGRKWSLNWLGSTHGALVVELTYKGATVNVVANHLPPFAWRAGYRRQCMSRLKAFMAGWSDPTIVGGDFNWRKTLESYVAGWLSSLRLKAATKVRASYGTSGKFGPGSQIDYLLARRCTLLSYAVQKGTDPATGLPASDHRAIVGSISTPLPVVPTDPEVSPVVQALRSAFDRLDAAKPGYSQDLVGRRSFYDPTTFELIPNKAGDCSSTAGWAIHEVFPGFDLSNPLSTRNIAERAKAVGFTEIPWSGDPAKAEAGDFPLAKGHHVVFAYDAKRWWSTEHDENGHATGGKPGQQPGEKVGFRAPYNSGHWYSLLRPPTTLPTTI